MAPYELVEISSEFFEFVRRLRTDPRNADSFINNNEITFQNQIDYMEQHLKDYFVCLSQQTPVGFIGVVQGDIRLAVDHDFRNRGVGTFMVNEISKLFPKASAKIKTSNVASIALFESAGFERQFYIYGKVEGNETN
ncbi:GNAT family N-acetyltransferase [Candidatus Planktophila dulcis]|uniref:GNAT family N-acetyltransferase n=1 Tax=Candidatus Planktophila dulcis TaxID=1884914 RepID=UPI003BEEF4CC